MAVDAFEYDARLSDYVLAFRRIAEDEGMDLPPAMQRFLRDLERDVDVRDSSLEDWSAQASAGTILPSISASKSVSGIAPTLTFTDVVYDVTDWESAGIIVMSSNTTMTVLTAGIIHLIGNLHWDTGTLATFQTGRILQNGNEIVGEEVAPSSAETRQSFSTIAKANAGDTFRMQCAHNHGSDFSILTARFQAVYLGPFD